MVIFPQTLIPGAAQKMVVRTPRSGPVDRFEKRWKRVQHEITWFVLDMAGCNGDVVTDAEKTGPPTFRGPENLQKASKPTGF